MADVFRCPACDEDLEGNLGRVPAAVDGQIVRVAIDCPACAEQIELLANGPWPASS